MRLFDNSAIKIDLFPGRKDKKNGKPKNSTKPPRVPTSDAHNADQRAGKDEPKSTVKAAKSMQNMERPAYQRPNTSRSFNNYTTGGSLVNHSASESEYEYDRPSTGHSEQSNTSRTYQQPYSSPAHTEHETVEAHTQQGPSWDRPDKSTKSGTYDYRKPHGTDSARNNAGEMPSADQRRSRADLQDEWEADQKLRTNIRKGAPHSTGHALKHKRSKADMIRATENMARTLSRSPHRSPANKRQLSAVDEVRPGTSSSNGSSRLPHRIQSSNTQSHGLSTTIAEGSGNSKLSQGQQQTNASINAQASTYTNPDHTNPDQPHNMTANQSDHTNKTGQKPQYDGLSPTKVSGVAKKQGKAFHSTIGTSSPLSMEPNKTTWSPTSSAPRRNNHSRTRSRRDTRSTTANQSQVTYDKKYSHADNSVSDDVRAERSNMQFNAGTNTESSPSHSTQQSVNNGYVQDDPFAQNKNRSSIDNKRIDHLSLAQRNNLARSEYANEQPQGILNRSNGTWASCDEAVSESSTSPRDSSDAGHDSSAGEGSHSGQSQATYNQPSQQATFYDIGSRSDHNNGSSSTAINQSGRVQSSHHEISYMKNYSRPSANDGDQSYSRTLDYSRTNTGGSSAYSNSASTKVKSRKTQPRALATRTKDFANHASTDSSSGNAQQKKTTANSSASRSKYVDAGNSTKSPFQGHFGSGKDDPRNTTGNENVNNNSNGGSRSTKFSNSKVVKNNINKAYGDSHTIKKKPSLSFNNHTEKNFNAHNDDVQASGRAKVVCINNGGSTVVDTPVTSDFTHNRKHDGFERKDSGQSDSWDFGGTSTYSKKQGGRDE